MPKRLSAATALGALGLLALALAIATSYSTVPGFSMWRNFISELGHPGNPDGWRLNHGFLVGGALTAVALIIVATLVRGALRWAAIFAVIGAASIAAVGHYPLHRGMAHVVPALLAVIASIGASVTTSITARRARTLDGRGRWLIIGLTAVQVLAIVGASLCALVLIQRGSLDPGHVFYSRAVRLANPFAAGSTINPIAIGEWTFFVASWLLLFGALIVGPRILRPRSLG